MTMDCNQVMVLLLSHKWDLFASKTSQSSLGASCSTLVPDLVSSPCLKGYNYEQVQVEMYRFPVFGLAEFIIAKQQSTSGATLGFYVCVWVDLGYFNTCPKAQELDLACRHPWWGWGEKGMEKGENQPRKFLQLRDTSLPCWPSLQQHFIFFLWPMYTKVNHKHLSFRSLEWINYANIQISCNTHLVCLLRTNPMAIPEVEGMWGGLRMHEEIQISLVNLYKHRGGVQTTGCTHTHSTPLHKDTCSQHQNKHPCGFLGLHHWTRKGWVGSVTLPCATRA